MSHIRFEATAGKRGWWVVLLASALLAGCGGGGDKEAAAPTRPEPGTYLLTSAEVSRIADRAVGNRDPVFALVTFWRNIEFSGFPDAYAQLSSELRAAVSYETFVKAMGLARPLFLNRPRVLSVERDGPTLRVFVSIETGSTPKANDTPLVFNMRREAGTWRISSDPANVLGSPVTGP